MNVKMTGNGTEYPDSDWETLASNNAPKIPVITATNVDTMVSQNMYQNIREEWPIADISAISFFFSVILCRVVKIVKKIASIKKSDETK